MHLYSFRSLKTLVFILYRLILLQTAQQVALQKRNVDDSSNNGHQDLTNRTFNGPVIVLMSSDTVSIVQLPMILYGNLTEVYMLADEYHQQPENQDGNLDQDDDEDSQDEDARSIEDDDDDLPSHRAAHHGSRFDADARETEQMLLHKMSVNRTTSLGKSGWQQIGGGGAGARDREEVSLPEQAAAGRRVAARDGAGGEVKEVEGEEEEGDDINAGHNQEHERHLGRRPRRSNSLRDHDDSSNNSAPPAARNEPSNTNETENSTKKQSDDDDDVGAKKHTLVRGAQESSKQNVTSAAAAAIAHPQQQQQQQPNLASTPVEGASSVNSAPAEEDDKISRSSAVFSSIQPGPSPSATSSSGAPASSSSSSSRIHFSDFDVHMSLGYAFVADSAGRIHRFKLPVAAGSKSSSSSASSHTGSKLRYPSYNAKSTVSNGGESVAIVNDDTTNAIDADSKFKSSPIQSKVAVDATTNVVGGGSTSNSTTANSTTDAASSSHDANRDSDWLHGSALSGSSDVNKVRSEQSNGGGSVTHEQTENESQHPAISGGQNDLSEPVRSNSGVSGTSRLSFDYDKQGFSFENLKQVDDVRPKIIWSRSSKHTTEAKTGRAYSAKQRDRQQLANFGGALPPQREINQTAAASAQTTNARPLEQATHPSSSDATPQPGIDGYSGNEIRNEQPRSNPGAGERGAKAGKYTTRMHTQSATMRTEIAVDWLNNLLFVLDKCRLLVMDFDGNNELILIDDFNANNRPVDIKVDPMNDFLFWLQVGKFHNTIYKLDLSVLSVPSATQKLVSNRLRLSYHSDISTSTSTTNNNTNDNGRVNFDASDLIPLVSHHYAHPIITNLPTYAKIFTIDHKHSRIYVPLSPSSASNAAADEHSRYPSSSSNSNDDAQAKRDDTEIFAPTDDVTHLNTTTHHQSSDGAPFSAAAECDHNNETVAQTNEGAQILAYNLDGTDVGPLRTLGDKSHINNLDGIEDLALNSREGLLYWLTNGGRDLFEEFKENSTIQPAQHYLYGKSYKKLIYFDDNNANQPTNHKPRFNVRKIIGLLSASISSNRQTRSGKGPEMSQQWKMDATRNAPYIILGITCLVVTTVYLIYALIFQRIHEARTRLSQCQAGGESMSGGESSIGADSHVDDNLNGFVNSTTISRWVSGGPSVRDTETSTFDRDINSFNRRLGGYDLESTNYEASNAVDDHYRGSTLNNQTDEHQFTLPSTSRLANLSEWPTNMHDLSNKLYVPVEVLRDEALSSIRRVSIDQLEIERTAPLGEGYFGTVLQGTIDCSKYQIDGRQRMASPCKAPISPDSLAPPSRARIFAPSTSSSGHGSSSSTSCEFATAHTDQSTTNRDDYLTPKNQLSSSTASDYGVEMPAASSSTQDESCSGYCDTHDIRSFRTTAASLVGTKLKVAIKKLKDNASSEEKRDFLQEAKLLANFNHPNIVHLIGICLDRGSTLIIMELMLGGDLIRYMQENTPRQANNYADDLTYDDLLKICLDIANGCCYLEDMDYIHRDLAARNCLVSSRKREERVVKLADFGLARDIYKDSYYKKMNDSAMPLKWMAPESLAEQKFTKKSDVWSFGVVMWEVMSYCQEKPYSGVEPFLMKEHLASGARLRQPDCCDDSMYRLMNQCWQMEPNKRPTFHECRAMLIEIKNVGRL
uniref:Tyrosine-protein kinase transforming protein ros n=1 Tax=Aceria tosichella TaxID=561515 RepID=A0A6G1SLA0_9ACAR